MMVLWMPPRVGTVILRRQPERVNNLAQEHQQAHRTNARDAAYHPFISFHQANTPNALSVEVVVRPKAQTTKWTLIIPQDPSLPTLAAKIESRHRLQATQWTLTPQSLPVLALTAEIVHEY
jgi:hypothetical protein